MQTLKQVAKAHRFAVMQPQPITERQALDAAIAATPYQPAQIVLEPVVSGHIGFEWVGNGNYCSAFDYEHMRCAGYIHRDHHSAYGTTWFGERVAFGLDGRKWRHDFKATVDDFGNLVEVQ